MIAEFANRQQLSIAHPITGIDRSSPPTRSAIADLTIVCHRFISHLQDRQSHQSPASYRRSPHHCSTDRGSLPPTRPLTAYFTIVQHLTVPHLVTAAPACLRSLKEAITDRRPNNFRLFIGHPITAALHAAAEKRSVIAELKHGAGPPFV